MVLFFFSLVGSGRASSGVPKVGGQLSCGRDTRANRVVKEKVGRMLQGWSWERVSPARLAQRCGALGRPQVWEGGELPGAGQ